MRRIGTPSPAMAVAMIALFVALGGSGYAATQSGGGGGDRANAAAKKKVKRGPRGRRGRQGVQGPQGLQGSTGAQGTPGTDGTNGTNGTDGTNGSPAFGALLGRGVNVPAGTSFLAPSGQLDAAATENGVDSFTPNATMRASDLAIAVFEAPGPGTSPHVYAAGRPRRHGAELHGARRRHHLHQHGQRDDPGGLADLDRIDDDGHPESHLRCGSGGGRRAVRRLPEAPVIPTGAREVLVHGRQRSGGTGSDHRRERRPTGRNVAARADRVRSWVFP